MLCLATSNKIPVFYMKIGNVAWYVLPPVNNDTCTLFYWLRLVSGADLLWEKITIDCLVADADLVGEKNTIGWLEKQPAEQTDDFSWFSLAVASFIIAPREYVLVQVSLF